MKKFALICLLALFAVSSFAQQFQSASFTIVGNSLPYRIMFPKDYDESKKYPLLIFLHGAGERGNDNQKQLALGEQFLINNFYSTNSSIVIVPQCPQTSYWANCKRHEIAGKMSFAFGITEEPTEAMKTLIYLIDDWLASGKINTSKVYVGGLSMGGMGTFELLWRKPNTFAAAFPICGGADLNKMPLYARNTAVWIFHGAADSVVPVKYSQEAYNMLKLLGCDARYTEYPGVDHASWDNVFQEKRLVKWLFDHKR